MTKKFSTAAVFSLTTEARTALAKARGESWEKTVADIVGDKADWITKR